MEALIALLMGGLVVDSSKKESVVFGIFFFGSLVLSAVFVKLAVAIIIISVIVFLSFDKFYDFSFYLKSKNLKLGSSWVHLLSFAFLFSGVGATIGLVIRTITVTIWKAVF